MGHKVGDAIFVADRGQNKVFCVKIVAIHSRKGFGVWYEVKGKDYTDSCVPHNHIYNDFYHAKKWLDKK